VIDQLRKMRDTMKRTHGELVGYQWRMDPRMEGVLMLELQVAELQEILGIPVVVDIDAPPGEIHLIRAELFDDTEDTRVDVPPGQSPDEEGFKP